MSNQRVLPTLASYIRVGRSWRNRTLISGARPAWAPWKESKPIASDSQRPVRWTTEPPTNLTLRVSGQIDTSQKYIPAPKSLNLLELTRHHSAAAHC